MGFFSEIAAEARHGIAYEQAITPAKQTVVTPPPVAQETPAERSSPTPKTPSAPAPAAPAPVATTTPTEPKQEPAAAPDQPEPQAVTPTLDLSSDADAVDEAERKRAHEEAEAKRKAEFDAKQAAKKAARREQLDRIKAMNDAELLAASVERVAADTERLTRRNMREAVAEHITAKCREDIAFSRLVIDPAKSMINCFKYITRKAREFAEKEMKDLGIEQTGTYGCDVPDGLCYQWAEDYFNDQNAKEDHQDDEKFVPKPYIPSTRKASKAKTKTSKKKPAQKKPVEEKTQAPALEQMSLV